MTREEMAKEYFYQGYNCAQALVLAFKDVVDLDEETLSKLACSFGGGMGRLREVCGSFSGILMIIGLLEGFPGPETGDVKAQHYAKIQGLAKKFEEEHGSIVCRELLKLSVRHDSAVPEERTSEYYAKRPCPEIIGSAAKILEEYLKEQKLMK